MMKLHIVTHQIGGYAREDAPVTSVVGAYQNENIANIVSAIINGKVSSIDVDIIPPGIRQSAKELGYKLENK